MVGKKLAIMYIKSLCIYDNDVGFKSSGGNTFRRINNLHQCHPVHACEEKQKVNCCWPTCCWSVVVVVDDAAELTKQSRKLI